MFIAHRSIDFRSLFIEEINHHISKIEMKRNCNLELQLMTPSTHDYVKGEYESKLCLEDEGSRVENPVTIFYNGIIANCNTTESQARAIIRLACREMEGKPGNLAGPCSPSVNSPISSPSAGVSMKRSLQRFLEKRKNRSQATYPYLTRTHPK